MRVRSPSHLIYCGAGKRRHSGGPAAVGGISHDVDSDLTRQASSPLGIKVQCSSHQLRAFFLKISNDISQLYTGSRLYTTLPQVNSQLGVRVVNRRVRSTRPWMEEERRIGNGPMTHGSCNRPVQQRSPTRGACCTRYSCTPRGAAPTSHTLAPCTAHTTGSPSLEL